MKTLIAIFLVLNLSLCVFAQEPVSSEPYFKNSEEKKIYKFPEGFSPDGKIGNVNFVVFGGKLQLSDDHSGYAVSGRLEYLVHESLTIFLGVDYQHLNYTGSAILLTNGTVNSTLYGGGFKIFGGM